MHIETKTLPETIQAALRSVGYGRTDIKARASETYTPAQASGDGYRCFVCAVEIATGRTETHTGSWGGANMFTRNAVDSDTTERALAPGFAIIEGRRGGGQPVYAELRLHPSNLAPLLPSKPELSDRLAMILETYKGYNSQGRKDRFERKGAPTADEIATLVSMGLIKVTRAGAVSVTTAGKNACK